MDVTQALEDGKELTQEQQTYLDTLEAEYEELGVIRDKTSDEYIEKLKEIQNEAEAFAVKEAFMEVTEEINAALKDTKNFSDHLDEIADKQWEIHLALKEDILSDLENLENKISSTKEAASSIGDGFLVSADNIDELVAAYPGILDAAYTTADGQI
jgi:small-conductance mechanosensitive channel